MELKGSEEKLLERIVKEWTMEGDEKPWSLGEFLHGAPMAIGERIEGRQLLWSFWEIVCKPDILIEIKKWVKQTIENMKWEFDIIGTMSYESSTIATLLSVEMKKPLIAIDNRTYIILPHDATDKRLENKRILLLDSIVQRGVTLKTIIENINSKGGTVIGCIVIAFNDFIPPEKRINEIDLWCGSKFLIYLHTLSQFYEAWVREGKTGKTGR